MKSWRTTREDRLKHYAALQKKLEDEKIEEEKKKNEQRKH